MSYITRITVDLDPEPVDLDLSAPGPGPRHLVLTGPNGSGKTQLMQAIAGVLDHLTANPEQSFALEPLGAADRIRVGRAMVQFSAPIREVLTSYARGSWLALHLPAERARPIADVPGPRRLDPARIQAANNLFSETRQFIVNTYTDMAYASVEGNEDECRHHNAQLAVLADMLAQLLGHPRLGHRFEHATYEFIFVPQSGRAFTLGDLGGGHATALTVIANLLIRVAQCRTRLGDLSAEPAGVALIDEIDAHLDPTTRGRILPVLMCHFPRVQFIVTALSDIELRDPLAHVSNVRLSPG